MNQHGIEPSGSKNGEVLVLGAGPAGLSAADILARRGYAVRVLDRADRCGGAHRSHNIGRYTFDVGSIFYEDSARIFDLAPGLREICPLTQRVQRRIGMEGSLLHYPIDPRDLLTWSNTDLFRAFCSLTHSRLFHNMDGTLEAICHARLGPMFFDRTGLKRYISRSYHVPASEIDESFFFHRMAFLEKATRPSALMRSIVRAIRRQPVRRGPPSKLRIRPAEGFDVMFDRIRTALEGRGVSFILGKEVEQIRRVGTDFTVQTSSQMLHAGSVVATIPLNVTHRALFGTGTGLSSLALMTLFVSASRLDPNVGNVLFNFHGSGRWKRATIYSRLYPDLMHGREFFSVEVTLPPNTRPDPEAAFFDLRTHLYGLGLASDLRLAGFDSIDSAYPTYTNGSGPLINKILSRVTETGIVMAGRQGRFEYLPTSTGVIRRVAEELDRSTLSANRTQSCQTAN